MIEPHFHKEYRIEEKDLIPNGQILTAIPESGQEGERITVEDPTGTFTIYQYIKGIWRAVGASPFTSYETAVANAAIDNTEHDIVSFSVPANTMADGDAIKIIFPATYQYNGGASTTLTIKLYYGSVSANLFSGTANNQVTTYKWLTETVIQRFGSNLYVPTGTTDLQSKIPNAPNQDNANSITPDFTIDQTVKITAKFSTTDTGTGITTGKARAFKIN